MGQHRFGLHFHFLPGFGPGAVFPALFKYRLYDLILFFKYRMLGKKTAHYMAGHGDISLIGFLQSGHDLKKCGLTRTIYSDNTNLFSFCKIKGCVVKQQPIPVRFRYIFHR